MHGSDGLHRHEFRYTAKSDRGLAEKWGGISVWFDANTLERGGR